MTKEFIEEQFKQWPTLNDFAKDYILDRIEDYEGQLVYISDLPYKITETDNCNGCVFYSTKKSLDFIANYRYDVGEIYEEWCNETGSHKPNPLLEPDTFCVMVFIECVSRVLYECKTFKELSFESGMVELSKDIIEKIVKELKGEDSDDDEDEESDDSENEQTESSNK